MNTKTKLMVQIALVTAVICVLSPFTIPLPFSPVPISLTIFAIYLGLYALNWKWGTVSILLYILIGLVGVPVFSGFSGGPGKLLGPTGGYIIGYIFVGIIAGWFIDKSDKIYMHAIGMVIGVAVCYAFGTVWFMYVYARTSGPIGVMTALSWCVLPYLLPDAVKIALASVLATRLSDIIHVD